MLYCLENARSPEQVDDMRALERDGTCIFCPEALRRSPEQRVLRETQHWIVTPNKYPYQGAKLHLLLVPKSHVRDLVDLPPDAFLELQAVLRWVRREYGLNFYGLGARCGDPRYTGGTIEHLHLHLLVGDVRAKNFVPVRLKLSSPGS